jgi:hypothetical protein
MRSSDSTSLETTPLLSSPRDHGAINEPEYPNPISPDPVVVHISRTDLIWVLTGLWSAVFLGALDGEQLLWHYPPSLMNRL